MNEDDDSPFGNGLVLSTVLLRQPLPVRVAAAVFLSEGRDPCLQGTKLFGSQQLLIAGNITEWKEPALQVSNVSSISAVSLERMPFPAWTPLIFLLGLFAFEASWMIAVALMAVAAVGIFYDA